MKRLTRILILSGLVSLTNPLGTASGHDNDLLAAEADQTPTKLTLQSNNDFAFDLYKQMSKEDAGGKNIFLSPYSISSAMAMATEGGRGNTAKQMGDVLAYPDAVRRVGDDAQHIPWQTSLIHTGLNELNKRFNAQNKPYQLAVANAMWGEKTFNIRDEFIKTISAAYDTGGIFACDFLRDRDGERKRINAWVENHTNDRIKDILPEEAITSDTRLVLTNAIFFKGDWAIQFDEKSTHDGQFTRSDGSAVQTRMMFQRKQKFPFAALTADGKENKSPWKEDPKGFNLASLSYKGDELSMLVIAPNDPKGLPAIEAKLTAQNLAEWTKPMRETEIVLVMPKFKMETTYDLIPTLKAMGITDAFKKGIADFSGISPSDNLYISYVIHKAFVEVNEQGTEAAAATVVVLDKESFKFTPSLRADRPFLFMIRDNKTGTILFMGRVTDPSKLQ